MPFSTYLPVENKSRGERNAILWNPDFEQIPPIFILRSQSQSRKQEGKARISASVFSQSVRVGTTFWSPKCHFLECKKQHFSSNVQNLIKNSPPRKSCAENLIFGRPAMNHSFVARNFFFYSASKSTKNAIEIWEISKVSLLEGSLPYIGLKNTVPERCNRFSTHWHFIINYVCNSHGDQLAGLL